MKNNDISAYIASLAEEWQREVCDELRKLVHEAAPRVAESMQDGTPHFSYSNGPLCRLVADADRVHLVFLRGARLPYSQLFEQDSGAERSIGVQLGQMVPAQEIIGLLREEEKLDRAG